MDIWHGHRPDPVHARAEISASGAARRSGAEPAGPPSVVFFEVGNLRSGGTQLRQARPGRSDDVERFHLRQRVRQVHRRLSRAGQFHQRCTGAPPGVRFDDGKARVRFIRSVSRLTAETAAEHVGQATPTWKQLPRMALGVHISAL
ncbi:hypothetical protein OG470_06470 [Micromonospora sp. NBC_00389]|uniref:hypothetical protein n=1 Tax=Micromonospora sp. NBC_00389 TaxID=2903586 RepID=UPI002E1F0011